MIFEEWRERVYRPSPMRPTSTFGHIRGVARASIRTDIHCCSVEGKTRASETQCK
jgi:hypothetical protein